MFACFTCTQRTFGRRSFSSICSVRKVSRATAYKRHPLLRGEKINIALPLLPPVLFIACLFTLLDAVTCRSVARRRRRVTPLIAIYKYLRGSQQNLTGTPAVHTFARATPASRPRAGSNNLAGQGRAGATPYVWQALHSRSIVVSPIGNNNTRRVCM